MKNIVICADGTGNNDIKARGTNVFKLYEAIDNNGHKSNPQLTPQVAFYHDGVGTSRFIPLRLLGEAVGWGFTQSIKDLYTELARAYECGDRLYLFGFSRGAYTVRTLAGLIQCCGIVAVAPLSNGEIAGAVDDCWQTFREIAFTRNENSEERRSPHRKERTRSSDEEPRLEQHQAGFSVHKNVKIEFLGVWDTVSAIGAPTIELRKLVNLFYPLTFAELTVGPDVQSARHAISIDDERLTFHPELWNEQYETDGRVLQVWFPGVHSNVGGGYPKQGMSLVALDWMMAEAEARGLRFIRRDRDDVRSHYDPHDKLYDSRASVAVYYRWAPRSIIRLCELHNMGRPKIHISAVERIANATDGYAPGNVPYDCEIVTTIQAHSHRQWPSNAVLQNIGQLIAQPAPQANSTSPFDENDDTVRSGRASYRAFLCVSLLAAFMLIDTAAKGKFWSLGMVVMAFIVVGLLIRRWAKHVDDRLNSAYAQRWRNHRVALRRVLGTDPARASSDAPGSDEMLPLNETVTGAMPVAGA